VTVKELLLWRLEPSVRRETWAAD